MKDSLPHRWLTHFRRVLLDVAGANAQRFQRKHNTFGLLRMGLKELRSTTLIVVPLDKQPGYCIVTPDTFRLMELKALKVPNYVPRPMSDLNFQSILSTLKSLAGDIARFHDDSRLFGNIMANVGHGTFACPLGISVKSHKHVGRQTLRTIHRGSNHCFSGLADWLVKVLQPLADSIAWSYKDSFSVRDALLDIEVEDSTILAKVDLKDFFLCGHPSQIADKVSKLIDNRILRGLIFRAITLLLRIPDGCHMHIRHNICMSVWKRNRTEL
jgi:hypothetical protein